ncbi:hypothetical protein BOTBODRAFT_306993 [Botryobasidium botryosum FD-172 SS1]|uniref:AB hydrolase-1 domain-containing protein n=1 Tax=Botryobasidium botryosum (strain FD-172 SS1) TaxID=930990 RepID=A0A067MXV6_BOTB1|nr:hypothetical protein BOTBODRAFT_306993 [Botryobasidium botryosum FD-172 SS1]
MPALGALTAFPFSSLIDQDIQVIPEFELESGVVLKQVPVAYKTWGRLNEKRDNVMVICHAFTGSSDVVDWWGPLMGPGKVFDPTRYLVFCGNVIGSPYGTVSPVTINPETNRPYGPEFPPTTIRDDVRLHKLILDSLSVTSVAVAIGGSMGGMTVLEWPLCTPPGYVRNIVPLATSARHSAWCISWGEAQRQSIYSDPAYQDGYYDIVGGQPRQGLAAARMSAMLTYRSRDSFESRFGRKPQPQPRSQITEESTSASMSVERGVMTPPDSPSRGEEALAVHNDGHGVWASARSSKLGPVPGQTTTTTTIKTTTTVTTTTTTASTPAPTSRPMSPPTKKPQIFSAQSYLRYQGEKFTQRFDANCYIHITRKLDTHDLARGRTLSDFPTYTPVNPSSDTEAEADDDDVEVLHAALSSLPPHALVISVETDGLFTPGEQREITSYVPHGKLVTIASADGHDGFLLEFEQINRCVLAHLQERLPEVYKGAPLGGEGGDGDKDGAESAGFEIKKTSTFGEAEVDVTRW